MSVNTRISPVGYYNPVDRLFPQQGTVPQNPTPASPNPVGQGVGNFFHDVWAGGKSQLKSDIQVGLHPIQSAKNAFEDLKHPVQTVEKIASPYVNAVRDGHPGEAVGRLLANVGVIGGLILGGRALIGAGTGGGASVGTAGPLDNILGPVGKVLGGVTHAVGSVVGGVFHFAGSIVRGIFGGGGAHVGFR